MQVQASLSVTRPYSYPIPLLTRYGLAVQQKFGIPHISRNSEDLFAGCGDGTGSYGPGTGKTLQPVNGVRKNICWWPGELKYDSEVIHRLIKDDLNTYSLRHSEPENEIRPPESFDENIQIIWPTLLPS